MSRRTLKEATRGNAEAAQNPCPLAVIARAALRLISTAFSQHSYFVQV
jgi:hypothetical protein